MICSLYEAVAELQFRRQEGTDRRPFQSRPKVPIQKLSPSRSQKSEAHVPGFFAFAKQMLGPDACGRPPPALSGVFLPRFFLRWRRKNRAPGGRWHACLVGISMERYQSLTFNAWSSRALRCKFAFAKHQSLYAVWVRLRCISSRSKIRDFDSRLLTNRAARSWSLTHLPPEKMIRLYLRLRAQTLRGFLRAK